MFSTYLHKTWNNFNSIGSLVNILIHSFSYNMAVRADTKPCSLLRTTESQIIGTYIRSENKYNFLINFLKMGRITT